jgi:Zn-dependent membrane protease YugP/Flp pilus assembly protein TadD
MNSISIPIYALLPTFILGLLPFLVVPAIWAARRRWKSVTTVYLATPSVCGLTGSAVAQRLLDAVGLSHISVTGNSKRDLYNWRKRQIQLQERIATSPTLPALAISAHEVGHAVQFAAGYFPVRLRQLFWPLFLAGVVLLILLVALPWKMMILSSETLFLSVLAYFIVLATIQLPATLALERDATRRARELVGQSQLITPGELRGFDQVLKAGFLTHLATVSCLTTFCGAVLLEILLSLSGVFSNTIADIRNHQPPVAATSEMDAIESDAPRHTIPDDKSFDGDPLELVFSVLWYGSALGAWGTVLVGPIILLLYFRGRRPSKATTAAVDRNNAAAALLKNGNLETAVVEYSEAIRLQPKLVAAYCGRGTCLTQLRRFDEALIDLDAAIRILPGVAAFLSSRATIHIHRGNFDRALIDCNEALRLTPESTDALCCRSVVWLRIGQFQKAIDDANQALQSDPNSFIAFNNRGTTLLKIGDYHQAEADLREAIRMKPEFPNPYKHLAWLQATCPQAEFRDAAQAVANATHALKLVAWKPVDWLATLAAAHAEAGNFDEAVKWQTKCLDESPETEKPELRKQLESYQFHKPFRDPPQNSAVIAEAQVVND